MAGPLEVPRRTKIMMMHARREKERPYQLQVVPRSFFSFDGIDDQFSALGHRARTTDPVPV